MNQRVQIKPLAQRSSAGSPRREIGATESAKSSKRIAKRQSATTSPLRDGFNAMSAAIKAAAERLGFDVSKPNWSKLLTEESRTYPFSLDEDGWLDLLPRRVRARLRALELIGGLTDVLHEIEREVQTCDEEFKELRAMLAVGPATIALPTYVKQLEEMAGHGGRRAAA